MSIIHKREAPVDQASQELRKEILRISEKYELTRGEEIRIIMEAAGGYLSNVAKYMIREERQHDE